MEEEDPDVSVPLPPSVYLYGAQLSSLDRASAYLCTRRRQRPHVCLATAALERQQTVCTSHFIEREHTHLVALLLATLLSRHALTLPIPDDVSVLLHYHTTPTGGLLTGTFFFFFRKKQMALSTVVQYGPS